jgi:hypothetical protein
MGKLAERYADATRSGVYRVADAGVPRTAAAEAGIQALEVTAAALAAGGWDRFGRELPARALVLLIDGADDVAARRPDEYARLVAALQAAALGARKSALPFFAVMVDPYGKLALPGLYKERE